MKPKQRWLILGSLLLATLAAGYFADDEPVEKGKRKKDYSGRSGASANARETRRGGDKQADLAAVPLVFPEPIAVENDAGDAATIDPFRNKSWYVAPPSPPPPKPTAPPLPFQYLGKLTEDGETRVFLNHQGKNLIARVGDVINGTYTVNEIAGGRMSLLYMPLNETQVLMIGTDK